MTAIAIHPEKLRDVVTAALGDKVRSVTLAYGEVTVEVSSGQYLDVMQILRNAPDCQFEMLLDLCGVDYSTYAEVGKDGPRFAVVSHLMSLTLNQRLRVRVYCADDDFPVVASINPIWNSANWFEREAFDLFGIVFEGHEDLRRILTDYGFIGHPFRKDFPCPVTWKCATTPNSNVWCTSPSRSSRAKSRRASFVKKTMAEACTKGARRL